MVINLADEILQHNKEKVPPKSVFYCSFLLFIRSFYYTLNYFGKLSIAKIIMDAKCIVYFENYD